MAKYPPLLPYYEKINSTYKNYSQIYNCYYLDSNYVTSKDGCTFVKETADFF